MMNKKKTLVILSPGFAANEADSACLPAQQQFINALHEQFPSIKLILLAFQYPFSDSPYLWKGNEVIPFNGRNRGKIYRLLLWLRVWKQLRTLKKQYHLIGLLSFWYGECALIGKWFGKNNHIKHFTWLLGQDAKEGNKFVRLLRPYPGELVALSDFLVKEFEKNYGVKPSAVIPIGIDTRLFPEESFKRDIDILGVGSLIPLKRYDLFIDVVKILKINSPFIKAVLCGQGQEQNRLQSMIQEAGLQDTITLTGSIPHSEVLQLMQRSKILLHPSSYEGFGMVCLEALYAGAQVISFCNPKDAWVRNWHIAADKKNMILLALEILQTTEVTYKPVLAYSIDDTATAVLKLYN